MIGIDTGITMVMVENARSGFVWETFMKNPEAQRGMMRAGFQSSPALELQDRNPASYTAALPDSSIRRRISGIRSGPTLAAANRS